MEKESINGFLEDADFEDSPDEEFFEDFRFRKSRRDRPATTSPVRHSFVRVRKVNRPLSQLMAKVNQ